MKRFGKLSIVIVVVAVSALLTACGNQTGNSSTGSTTAKESLVWSGWAANEKSTKPSIDQMTSSWNKAHPDQTVTWQGWPYDQTEQQLIIRSQGGQKLDLAQIDMNWLPTLASTGDLVNLESLLGKQWLQSNFTQNQLNLGQVGGKQYGVPWSMASIGMVYNPTLLKSVSVSAPPQTTQEFEKDLELLKAKYPNSIPYALSTKGTSELASDFQIWLWTFHANVFDAQGNPVINSQGAVQALTFLKDLKDKGLIKMDVGRFDARQFFAKGDIGFYLDAFPANAFAQTNGVPAKDIAKTIQPMPMPVLNPGDHPQSLAWGHLLVVFNKSKDLKTDAAFIKHVLSPSEELMYFKNTQMPPVEKSVVSDSTIQGNAWTKDWLSGAQFAKRDQTSAYTNQSKLQTIIGSAVQSALLGQTSPQQALNNAENQIKSAVKK
ncbi:putative ABC transporter-binding protein precursor [Peptococcaceae bacterium CEB3]|nr:putative ABC transporter-binding protein precursor [Peptococcaceae bacterium CEB3]